MGVITIPLEKLRSSFVVYLRYICYTYVIYPANRKSFLKFIIKMFSKTNKQKNYKKKKTNQPTNQTNKSEIQILFCHAILHLGAHKFLFKCDKTKICT